MSIIFIFNKITTANYTIKCNFLQILLHKNNIITFHNLLDFIIKILITFLKVLYFIYKNIMRTLFKVLRWFFYFLTIVTGVVYRRGEVLFEWNFELIKSILIPGYLVFCGLMLWYLIATFWAWNENYKDDINKERIATRSFLIGLICWIIFALVYIMTAA